MDGALLILIFLIAVALLFDFLNGLHDAANSIAPIRAPKITWSEMTVGSMIPRPMVSATCRPKNRKARKLKKAAQPTA